MSKLLKLKEWLTIDDAARHLSMMFEEEVTEADIFRLALDGHLTLSVNFVNGARARRGSISIYSDEEIDRAIASGNLPQDLRWSIWPPDLVATLPNFPEEHRGKPLTVLSSDKIGPNRYLTLESSVQSIDGVWDLPMIGAERLDVEHRFQLLTGGPSITMTVLEGPLVQRSDDELWNVMESFDDNEFQAGSKKQRDFLELHIAETKPPAADAKKLRDAFAIEREEYLKRRKSRPSHEDYHPAHGLPADVVFVVRTSALLDLQQRTSEKPAVEKPLGTKERKTLLSIIAALCSSAGYDYKRAAKTASLIQLTADQMGINLGETTIEQHLKKIPDALESRMK